MNKLPILLLLLFFVSCKVDIQSLAETDQIKLNSLGYLPKAVKKATVTAEAQSFQVVDATTRRVVLKGKLSEPVKQEDVNQEVRIADFSKVSKPGTYILNVEGLGKSYEFAVGPDVYREAYVTSMRGFYLWRCGMAVEGEHQGNHFHTEACHLEDGWQDYVGQPNTRRDGTGGWHDAGDYGKYTVNAGVTVGVLFYAWEHFGEKLKDISLNIPQTAAGMPDYLQELKWETDFLLKMQYPDGSGRVSHKLTRVQFAPFIMPQEDLEKRYFTEWGTAATADFVAMMAMAARYFEPFDAAYAAQCLEAAKVSYTCLVNNPEPKNFEQGDFQTGGYQTNDDDDRLWAAAEMWQTTGDAAYLADLEARIASLQTIVEDNWDWGNVSNLGVYTYVLSKREGRNAQLVEKVKQAAIESADKLVANAQADVYARPLGGRYYWGCNGTIGRQAVNLQVANLLSPDAKYTTAALDIVAHLFGRNFYGRSYVTGLGVNPPMKPHDRRSGADGIDAPWPGYIVGGGHTATDWVDLEESYSHNEIAINWQAGLVYALALGL